MDKADSQIYPVSSLSFSVASSKTSISVFLPKGSLIFNQAPKCSFESNNSSDYNQSNFHSPVGYYAFAIILAVVFGWALGANDAANVYGTAVTSGLIKYRVTWWYSAVFIVVGALWRVPGTEAISSVSVRHFLLLL